MTGNYKKNKLIFVYNAQSGLGEKLIDGIHKIVSPSTYNCKLCQITFGKLTEKKSWKEFREHDNIEMEFLYKDEFQDGYSSKFGHKYDFPIVLIEEGSELHVFISPEELNELQTAEELMEMVETRVSGLT